MIGLSARELNRRRQDMQMIFQDPYASLNPRMTVQDILKEPLSISAQNGGRQLSSYEINQRINFLLDKISFTSAMRNRYPHEFSGGQRQRIGIARALMTNPKVILADEPVSALDVSIQAQILNLLKDLQSELGLTYLFIAHDLAVVKYMSDDVVVMYLGAVAEQAPNEDLYSDPKHPYTQALLSAVPIPDPAVEKERQRIVLTGDIPSPIGKKPGCFFYDRCFRRMPKCATNRPAVKEVAPGHKVACFLHHDEVYQEAPVLIS
jgi:oligopeptide transport system ATP-binding protein